MPVKTFEELSAYNLKLEDAFEWLRFQPTESADLVVTDPPYESLEKHRKIGTTTRLKGQWFDVIRNDQLIALMVEFWRVLKPGSHCYVFCDQETLFHLKPAGEAAGFKFWKPLVWDKVNIGMGYHYRCRHEFIVFFEKGKRKLNSLSVPDVLTCKATRGEYPTMKPVSVISTLIEQSSSRGQLVIDPFMGSCSTGVAALKSGRKFAGCDMKPEAFSLSCERMAQAFKDMHS